MGHKIIKGNEKCGICGKCGMQGDLTAISCKEGTKRRNKIETTLKVKKMLENGYSPLDIADVLGYKTKRLKQYG